MSELSFLFSASGAKLVVWGPCHPRRSRPRSGVLTGDDNPDLLAAASLILEFNHLLIHLLARELHTRSGPEFPFVEPGRVPSIDVGATLSQVSRGPSLSKDLKLSPAKGIILVAHSQCNATLLSRCESLGWETLSSTGSATRLNIDDPFVFVCNSKWLKGPSLSQVHGQCHTLSSLPALNEWMKSHR